MIVLPEQLELRHETPEFAALHVPAPDVPVWQDSQVPVHVARLQHTQPLADAQSAPLGLTHRVLVQSLSTLQASPLAKVQKTVNVSGVSSRAVVAVASLLLVRAQPRFVDPPLVTQPWTSVRSPPSSPVEES